MRFLRTVPCAALLVGLMFSGATAFTPPTSPSQPYRLSVSALAGPAGTDLTVQVTAPAGGALPTTLKKLSLSAPGWSRSLSNVPLSGGQWTARYTDLPRGKALTAKVEFKTTRTWNLCANTVVLHRPDVRFLSVNAPTQAQPNEVLTVPVVLQETRGDLGATFDLAASGAIQPVTATGIRVNPHGSTQVILNLSLTGTGTQTITLRIQNQTPGDYDPSNNTASFTLQVTQPLAPTQYYGGYYRWEGTSYSSYPNHDGTLIEGLSDGKYESLDFVCSSNQPMSWPMSGSWKMKADGNEVYSVTLTDVYPTETYSDGGSAYFRSFAPDYDHYIWITLSAPGSSPAVRYSTDRTVSDYVQTITQHGQTTVSIQKWGTFLNATGSAEMSGTLTSAMGRVGGGTGSRSILYARRDDEYNTPNSVTRINQDTWSSYSSGDLQQ